ncbi:zinc-ribbon domain-containing protein [Streptomyces pseudovenezuelae]|uniref:zinc-ribbon domain-containing protein n=1 Tax=Streptomyces pseudovenezuelae TaxID=67350 RepID=UPI0037181C54
MVNMHQRPQCQLKRRAEQGGAEVACYQTTPVGDLPELIAAWADEADPPGYQHRQLHYPRGHRRLQSPLTRNGCPSCGGQDTRVTCLEAIEADSVAFGLNAEIAAQWHPTKNGKLQLSKLSSHSRRRVWWRDEDCGHEWQKRPARREQGQRLRCRGVARSSTHSPTAAPIWRRSDSQPIRSPRGRCA